MKDHKNPRPYIHHSVCPQSGLQELWLMCGDKVLAGPARLPDGWVSLYNIAKMEANMDFSDLDTTAKPQPEPAWVANKAAFDAMEDGQGPYMHRKNLEGGVPVEWPAFKNWAENKLGQGYSLACCEGALVDSVTSWCFTGFQAGMEYAYETSRPAPGQAAATGPNDKEAVVALLRDVVRDIRAWGSTGLFSAAEKLAMLADRFERGHLRELVQQRKEQK